MAHLALFRANSSRGTKNSHVSREKSHRVARSVTDTLAALTIPSTKANQQSGANGGSANIGSSLWPWATHTISFGFSLLLFKRWATMTTSWDYCKDATRPASRRTWHKTVPEDAAMFLLRDGPLGRATAWPGELRSLVSKEGHAPLLRPLSAHGYLRSPGLFLSSLGLTSLFLRPQRPQPHSRGFRHCSVLLVPFRVHLEEKLILDSGNEISD